MLKYRVLYNNLLIVMPLTRFKQASIGELGAISLPLILTSLSTMMMIFVDRILLALYSTEAMNAATNASTLGWAFWVTPLVLTGIAEVFVAQYNGARRSDKIASPIWQMLWLAVSTAVFFLPLSLWAAPYLFGGSPYYAMEKDYFEVMMLFGPVPAMYGALAAFWIGRGKTTIITVLAIVTNLVNGALDYLLIFGVEGWIPSMGTRGAAWATSVGGLFQVAILLGVFLKREYRQRYNTGDCSLDWNQMLACIRVGLPTSLFLTIEVFGWAVFYRMMTQMGHDYITVAAVAQSLALLLWAVAEGMQKGVITVAGNLIGAGKSDKVGVVLTSAWKLVGGIYLVVASALFFGVDVYIGWFVDGDGAALLPSLRWALAASFLYALGESLRFSIGGALTAAGDTFFLMIANSSWIWLGMLIPVQLFVVYADASIDVAMGIWVFYAFSAAAINYWRFRSGRWRDLQLIAA